MEVGSLVHAAYREQKALNLPWYKNIESLLKLDKLFETDHVTAFKKTNAHKKNNFTFTNQSKYSPPNIPVHLAHLKTIKPMSCKQYRIENT